jgi:basic membrane protein A
LTSAERFGWDKLIFVPEIYESESQEFERTLDAGCDLIVTNRCQFVELVAENAIKLPGQHFLLLDYVYDQPLDNVWTVSYTTDQGSFLAGYLAAALTRTGVIGTFGGVNLPQVTDFMIGFESGMAYYNRQFGDNVKLLGWNTAEGEGYFTGNFCCHPEGYDQATELLEQGADIIFPVAGEFLGVGAMQAVMERGNAYLIGVDKDYAELFPQYAGIVLTSVEKRFDVSILVAAEALANGNLKGGKHLGTLETGEVGLSPFHELEAIIPEHIKSDLEQIKADIIAGVIQTKPGE